MKPILNHILFFYLVLILLVSCNPTAKIKDGSTAYQLKKYNLASNLLQNDITKAKSSQEKIELIKKIAFSFDMQNNFEQAELWYNKLYQEIKI